MYIHWPVYFPSVNPHSDPVPRAPNWCMAQIQDQNMLLLCFLPPLSLPTPAQPESQRNPALCGLGTSGHRAIFSQGLHKHTRARKNLPLTGGDHGNWHRPQSPVSRYPSARNHARSPAVARRAARTEVLAFKSVMRFFMGPSDWFERNSAAILVRCTGWMLTSLWGCSRVHSFGGKKC